MIKKVTLFLMIILCFSRVNAAHLAGGDLTFQCRGNNLYSFQLKVYRDAFATAAHDNPAYIFIYNNDNGQLFLSRGQAPATISTVVNNDLGPCLQNPSPPRFDFATYNFTGIQLPPNNNGYRVVYQRCCRTNDLINIIPNFDGIAQGSTYEIQITPKVMQECNGSAVSLPIFEFQEFPPTQLCASEEVIVDQSVRNTIFPFADSVIYSLCAPFSGGSGTNCIIPDPNVTGSNCNTPDGLCDAPCSYAPLIYSTGYSFQTPMGNLSQVEIDKYTGELIVNPRATGVYVVGLCAVAYKDGQIWSTNRRDFQFKVFDCIADGATPPIAQNGDPLPLNTVDIDSIVVESVYLVCNELTVNFQQSSPQALSYWWDFGVPGVDSDTSILANPVFTYPDTGTYVVTFVVNINQPCVDTAYGVVKIFPQFEAEFSFVSGCFSIPVQFTDLSISTLVDNPIVDWQWTFGDGTTANVPSPTHQYTQASSFNVTLNAATALGCTDSYSATVVTQPAPLANFTNLLNCTGFSHQFNNTSTLNGTNLDKYIWDFGLGGGFNFETTEVQPPLQTYNTAGDYEIGLIVISTSGCSDTIRQTLVVRDTVQANFVYSATAICPGQAVQFSNTTSQSFDDLLWSIDGSSFNTNSPIYTFETPGIKTVSLIVYSNTVCGDTLTREVLVENGPTANFEVDSACTTLAYTFENTSQDNGFIIDDYIWDFGDGTSASGFSPTHTYNTPGNYDVSLVVSSSLAICSDTMVKTISVKEIIAADFTFSPDTICADITAVTFANASTGGSYDSLIWDTDDDSLILTDNPTYLFSNEGNYAVTLSIYDDICGASEMTKSVAVLKVPEANLPDSVNLCDGVVYSLQATGNQAFDILWSTGQTSEGIIIDNSLDTVIIVIDNSGCISSDTTIITKDCPAYLPNSFTPNGDGVNDVFLPLPFNITSFTLKIYDRWGDLVFETDSFTNGWDGRYSNGSKAPLDVYNYVLDGVGLDEKVLFQHGIVQLIR
jgi:gliding motility-associated-like protein